MRSTDSAAALLALLLLDRARRRTCADPDHAEAGAAGAARLRARHHAARVPPARGPRPALRVPDRVVVLHRPARDAGRGGASASSSRSSAAASRPGRRPRPASPRTRSTSHTSRSPTSTADATLSAERVSRGAAGLAGASGEPFRVAVEDWSAEGTSADGSSVRLQARDQGLVLDLELRATKPLVLHGDRGLSAKSAEPGNASYYVVVHADDGARPDRHGRSGAEATGEAWFDHEWSTSALGPGAVGWDWWSLQLDDGRELMFFEIRRQDGGRDAASSGTLVAADGRHAPADRRRRGARRCSSAGRVRDRARPIPLAGASAWLPRRWSWRSSRSSPTRSCGRRSRTGRAPSACRARAGGRPWPARATSSSPATRARCRACSDCCAHGLGAVAG